MWSGPRNVSTALMYSWGNRPDTIAIDEPFYAHYLVERDIEHPGWMETLDSQSSDYLEVIKNVLYQKTEKPVMYIKNMTHHSLNMSLHFLDDLVNLFLIRDPGEVIASYIKNIPNPDMEDLGYKRQWEMIASLQDNGKEVFVVDSKELLTNPRIILGKMCAFAGIRFEESMLKWEPGPKAFDGVWAPYWYDNVHRSTGFNRYEKKKVKLTQQYKDLEKECRAYYDKMAQLGVTCY
ncbi:MAG: sulfotransferase family protein [Bacteroidota bacterium]